MEFYKNSDELTYIVTMSPKILTISALFLGVNLEYEVYVLLQEQYINHLPTILSIYININFT